MTGIKGSSLNCVINYADCVEYIHKNNLTRHVKAGSLHDWASDLLEDEPFAFVSDSEIESESDNDDSNNVEDDADSESENDTTEVMLDEAHEHDSVEN